MGRNDGNYGNLNIHYGRNMPVEIIEPGMIGRMLSRIRPDNRIARTGSLHKAMSRRRAIQRRRRMCQDALSQTPGAVSSRPDITARNLDDSPFLNLPIEIRQQIYALHYQAYEVTVHDVAYDGSYFLAAICPFAEDRPPGRQAGLLWETLMGLPLTCRTIYPEASVYLYSKTGFRFTDPRLALRIPEMIPMKHLERIQSVRLAFLLPVLVDYIRRPGVCAVDSILDRLMSPFRQNDKRNSWPVLWSNIAALPKIRNVGLKVSQHTVTGCQAATLVTQPWLSEHILEPVLQLNKDCKAQVEINVCWHPGPTQVELLENCGVKVKYNF